MPAEQPDLTCPVCGKGPFRALGIHAAKKHGITATELKAQMGMPKSHSLNSPDVQEAAAERARRLGLVNAPGMGGDHPRHRGPQLLSEAGRRAKSEAARIRAEQTRAPDMIGRPRQGLINACEAVRAAERAHKALLRKRNRLIRAELRNGWQPTSVARATGLTVQTILHVRDRRGVWGEV